MFRGRFWRSAALSTAFVVALSTAAWADPPSGTPGHGANAGSTVSSGTTSGSSTGTADGSGTTGGTTPASHGVGGHVSDAVQAALAAGLSGSALANAVHQVILSEKPNAKGLTVAEAIYDRLSSTASTSSISGGTSGTSGTSGSTSGTSTLAFSDLDQAPWANDAVAALKQAGVVNGTAPDQFSPNNSVTQVELATMLARLQAGTAPDGTQVPDGTPDWAKGSMGWAVSSSVLAGVQGLGAPDDPVTRAQAVTMLLNAASLGSVTSQSQTETINLSGDVPDWAHGALALAIDLGILEGSNGQLLADQPLTRAQMAVLMTRLAQLEVEATSSSGS